MPNTKLFYSVCNDFQRRRVTSDVVDVSLSSVLSVSIVHFSDLVVL